MADPSSSDGGKSWMETIFKITKLRREGSMYLYVMWVWPVSMTYIFKHIPFIHTICDVTWPNFFSSAFLPFSIHDFVCTTIRTIYALPKTFPNYKEKLVDDENFSNVVLIFFYFWQVLFGVRSKTLHITLIFLLLGLMSIKGYQNLQQSYSRLGR